MGSEEEAFSYAGLFRRAWEETPGALVWLRTGRKALSAPKVGRNAPCPYGSGRKYKKCCGA